MSLIARPNAYATSTEALRYFGRSYVCSPGTTVNDIPIEEDVRLAGGKFWASGQSIGDTISLSIVDPSGTVVAVYCDSLPVSPSSSMASLDPPTAAFLAKGLSLRISYNNVGSSDVNIGVWINWFEV